MFLINTPHPHPGSLPLGQILVRQNEDKPSELILQGTTGLVKTNNYIFVCVCEWGLFCSLHHNQYGLLFFKTTTELKSRRWDWGKIIHHKAYCLAEIQLVFFNRCSQFSWISALLFNFHNCKKAILTFLLILLLLLRLEFWSSLLCHTDVTLPVALCSWESWVSLHKSGISSFLLVGSIPL